MSFLPRVLIVDDVEPARDAIAAMLPRDRYVCELASNAALVQGGAAWAANPSGGSGTITVTALTSTRVAGTFQFTGAAVSGTGASATRQVTSGKFDLSF